MTLQDLRTFVAVVEAGTMGKVARSIRQSQPAIAQHVRRLEREFGTVLLDRTPRGVELTDAGRALYERTSAALAALNSAETEIEAIRHRSDGALAVSASSGTARHYLKPAIVELRRRRPGLDFRLACANTLSQQLDAIRQRRADLAFVSLSEETPGFEQRPVLVMPYQLLVHKDDPLARRKRIHLEELAKIRYLAVGRESTTSRFVATHLAARGRRLAVAQTVDTEGTAILYVELGLGHALVPAIQADALTDGRELRGISIRGLPAMPLGWVARDFRLLSSAAREFLDVFDHLQSQ